MGNLEKNQLNNVHSLNPDDFKSKNFEDVVDTVLSNLDSTTEETWNALLDKIPSHANTPPIEAFRKIYDNIDSILNQQIPDRLILVLYGNATNIFSDSEELKEKIYRRNPELISSKFQVLFN